MQSTTFLISSEEAKKKCLMCNECCSYIEKTYNFGENRWGNFKLKAKNWHALDIPNENEYFVYETVYDKITDRSNAFGKSHCNCNL